MLQSLPAPLNLQSIENKGKSELKFVVQNTATKLSSDFIITYKGGDIGEWPWHAAFWRAFYNGFGAEIVMHCADICSAD